MKKKVLTIATASALVALAGFSVHANTTTASTTQGITPVSYTHLPPAVE